MRVIIAGSRSITDYPIVVNAIANSRFNISEVICGMARGVDSQGLRYAITNGIPYRKFPADWNRYGRSAGHRRNKQMADNADALILVWDGVSHGSANMLEIANSKGLKVYQVVVEAQDGGR